MCPWTSADQSCFLIHFHFGVKHKMNNRKFFFERYLIFNYLSNFSTWKSQSNTVLWIGFRSERTISATSRIERKRHFWENCDNYWRVRESSPVVFKSFLIILLWYIIFYIECHLFNRSTVQSYTINTILFNIPVCLPVVPSLFLNQFSSSTNQPIYLYKHSLIHIRRVIYTYIYSS